VCSPRSSSAALLEQEPRGEVSGAPAPGARAGVRGARRRDERDPSGRRDAPGQRRAVTEATRELARKVRDLLEDERRAEEKRRRSCGGLDAASAASASRRGLCRRAFSPARLPSRGSRIVSRSRSRPPGRCDRGGVARGPQSLDDVPQSRGTSS
jgi:hypothetical protein